MILVVDASVLITLARIGRLQLLNELADEIVVPFAVYDEVVGRGAGRLGPFTSSRLNGPISVYTLNVLVGSSKGDRQLRKASGIVRGSGNDFRGSGRLGLGRFNALQTREPIQANRFIN